MWQSPGARENDAGTGWVFARNLPSNVSVQALKSVFGAHGQIAKICVMNGRSAETRSCAFIKYLLSNEAELAARMLHGRYEMEPGTGPVAVRADAPGVFLKNLPVDIEEEMVHHAFSLYGKVETVHIAPGGVKRDDVRQNTRGPSADGVADRPRRRRGGDCGREFAEAFVEYSSAAEAETAALALRSDQNPLADGEDSNAPYRKFKNQAASENQKVAYCVVCMEKPKTHAFVPCGHRCVCEECGDTLARQTCPTCPVCRAVIEQVLQIYL